MSRGPYPILLMLAMSMPGAVRALGLGEIRVDSALNEPLSAQIDIVGATRDELIALTAKVANQEIFQRYGADRPAFLSSATFKVGLDAQGRPVLNVRSAEAFTDPLINFLVDLRWGRGELIREYSLLLDPAGFSPVSRPAAAAVVSAPATPADSPAAPVLRRAPAPAASSAIAAKEAPAKDASVTVPSATLATHHRVAARDTLRAIARRAGARSESHAQRMMIAIFRANPHAFQGNINRLHLGALLTIPSGEDVAAIDPSEAKHEVRTQMTSWRLDGRPDAARRVAATPSAPVAAAVPTTLSQQASNVAVDASATEALKGRVQSLEQALDDMHRQLANDNARIQDLKQQTAPAAAAPVSALQTSSPAAPVSALQTPAPAAPVTALQTPAAAAPVSARATVVAPVAPAASAMHVEIMRAGQPAPALAAVAPALTHPMSSMAVLAPAASALALLVGGFAYLRRRLSPDAARPKYAPEREEHGDRDAAQGEKTPDSPQVTGKVSPPAVSVTAKPRSAAPVAAAPVASSARETPEHAASDQTTQSLAIDAEALEQSYLDLGIDSLGIDTVVFEPGAIDAGTHAALRDAADTTHNTTGLETVAMDASEFLDASEFETAATKPDLKTLVMETEKLEPATVNSTVLDYNLLDLDATAQHVHMPSELNDHTVRKERRTNIVDVLKQAIERDPHRGDLRMKLLETYYSAAATNQRAFLDVVRTLGRERDFLSTDDWKKVVMMGREIAGDDILFAETPKDDHLAA